MITRKESEAAKRGMEQFKSDSMQLRVSTTAPACVSGTDSLQTRWGVGFGPRPCCDYATGISTIPIENLTEADRKWMLTAEYGGTGGKPIQPQMVVEEPDIEIGAGVSSKGESLHQVPGFRRTDATPSHQPSHADRQERADGPALHAGALRPPAGSWPRQSQPDATWQRQPQLRRRAVGGWVRHAFYANRHVRRRFPTATKRLADWTIWRQLTSSTANATEFVVATCTLTASRLAEANELWISAVPAGFGVGTGDSAALPGVQTVMELPSSSRQPGRWEEMDGLSDDTITISWPGACTCVPLAIASERKLAEQLHTCSTLADMQYQSGG